MQTVLVIDDDLGVLDLVQEILAYEGYKVTALSFCKDILETVRQYRPDLVIMDYFLYGENGGTFCQLLKGTAATAHLPVILYSAYPNIKKSLDQFGCDAFLEKPFDLAGLTQTVHSLLQQNARP